MTVSFSVCAGEVLGIAGVQGNGQTELVEALTGLREISVGQGDDRWARSNQCHPSPDYRAGRGARA